MGFEGKWLLLLLVALVIQGNGVSSKSLEAEVESTKQYMKNEISDVLKMFDDILVPDVAAPAVADPVTYCYEPEDELQEIQNVFTSTIGNDRIVSITMVLSSTCTEIVKVKSAILKLKLDLYQLSKHILSVKFEEEKANYMSKARDVLSNMDNVYNSAVDPTKVSKLRDDLITLETSINAVLVKLGDKKQELADKTLRLCVDDLKANRIDAAILHYREIADKTVIKEIISAAYEDVDSFKVLFKFIRHHIKDSMSVLNGFVALFESITAKNHVKIENLIIFIDGVSKYNGSEFEDLTKSLYNSLRSADYTQFFEFYGQVNHRDYYEAFGFDVKVLMQIFVRGTLNNDVKNVVKVLDMKTKFTSMEDRLELLTALMREMINNKHLVNSPEMMIMIYDVMEIRHEVDSQYNVVNKLTVNELYNSVPDALKSLMYNNLCIRNINNGDYVYAGPVLDDKRRSLYATKRVELTTPNDPTFVFQAQFIDRGRKLLFKNSFGEHLYFTAGDSPRRVLSWLNGSLETDKQAYFMVERTDEMSVKVRSVEYDEYMYADTAVSADVKNVNVNSGKDVVALWSLETCPFHYNI